MASHWLCLYSVCEAYFTCGCLRFDSPAGLHIHIRSHSGIGNLLSSLVLLVNVDDVIRVHFDVFWEICAAVWSFGEAVSLIASRVMSVGVSCGRRVVMRGSRLGFESLLAEERPLFLEL